MKKFASRFLPIFLVLALLTSSVSFASNDLIESTDTFVFDESLEVISEELDTKALCNSFNSTNIVSELPIEMDRSFKAFSSMPMMFSMAPRNLNTVTSAVYGNNKPQVSLIMKYDGKQYTYQGLNNQNTSSTLYKTTTFEWDYTATDLDGDSIVDVEWKNNNSKYLTYDNQVVGVRVKDSKGDWSDWSEVNFKITNRAPTAQLKYIIMNKDSIKNGQITTNTQIAWLWSYGNQTFIVDPDGDNIVDMKIDGVSQGDIVGNLNGNIGFATKFKEAGQYTLEFKCKDSGGLWSNTWKINIVVEPADNNTRPNCQVNYTVKGNLSTDFVFNWSKSSDPDAGDRLTDIQYKAFKDGALYPFDKLSIETSPSQMKVKFTEYGTYQFAFRVKDSHNAWSNWVYATVNVEDINNKPNCQVSYTTMGDLGTNFVFDWSKSSDPDANDSISNMEFVVYRNGVLYSNSKLNINKSSSKMTVNFTEPGSYQFRFRVQDSKGAWSNWVYTSVEARYNTPDGKSASEAWNKIKSNSKNPTSHEAYSRSIPKDSKYIGTHVIDGKKQDFYMMTMYDKYRYSSNNPITQFDTCFIYNQDYLAQTPYKNGYYGTWFPENYLTLDNGVVSADVGFKKYKDVPFNHYRKLFIYDFFNERSTIVDYFTMRVDHHYFFSTKFTDDDKIVYGQHAIFGDDSGRCTLVKIDRKTGSKITNTSLEFENQAQLENGLFFGDNRYAYISTVDDVNRVYILDFNTLKVLKTFDGDYTGLAVLPTGDLALRNTSNVVIDKDTLNIK